ncbi:hypothetical protein tv_L2 [Megavirus courdo7]|uniref:Uncharacterized protein n=1 Tax=Megavirus courdo7 TaxID=1128135 RepID=H6WBC9_9VIRU|nr:hypothetical protein tv_L2 [Megavirus courdo7]
MSQTTAEELLVFYDEITKKFNRTTYIFIAIIFILLIIICYLVKKVCDNNNSNNNNTNSQNILPLQNNYLPQLTYQNIPKRMQNNYLPQLTYQNRLQNSYNTTPIIEEIY